jgi:hypothetical protein
MGIGSYPKGVLRPARRRFAPFKDVDLFGKASVRRDRGFFFFVIWRTSMDIMTTIATAGQAIKLAQDLRGIDKAMDAAEYKLKIADLLTALSDIKMALADAKEELAGKDKEIAALKKQFQRSAETVEIEGFKYDRAGDGQPMGVAYCPVCEQNEGRFFHLARMSGTDMCPHCKSAFGRINVY